jgi:hypothetical protein
MKEKNSKKYIRKVSVEFLRTKVPHKTIRSQFKMFKVTLRRFLAFAKANTHWSHHPQEAWIWEAEKDQRGNQEAH